jgi:hypothetical protein
MYVDSDGINKQRQQACLVILNVFALLIPGA